MTRNKLYVLVIVACLSGFVYLFFRFSETQQSVCLIKNVTGYPCPSCGTTRAVQLIFQGKITESFLWNPFGIIVVFIMAVVPVWVLTDVATKKDTFFTAYKKTERFIQKKWIAIPLIVLVVLNWIWNFYKQV